MNWVFIQREALRINPAFWFEMSVWDGDTGGEGWKAGGGKVILPKPEQYRRRGQAWTPERYEGSTQFGMWLLRPRSVREFRGHGQPREPFQAHWEAIPRAVDRVHDDATLSRFWRAGELVPNRSHPHPFQTDMLPRYANEDRWFLLDTSLDPPRPWTYETELPVFALALVVGEPGSRTWLMYAHAPLGERKDVRVSIPGFREVTVDVPVAGAFHAVEESTGAARRTAQ